MFGHASNGVSPPGGGFRDSRGFAPLSPPSDREALPRLGWYLYLLTKDVLGFRCSNASFVSCLELVLASLGAVVWNMSPRSLPSLAEAGGASGDEGGGGGGGRVGGGVGGGGGGGGAGGDGGGDSSGAGTVAEGGTQDSVDSLAAVGTQDTVGTWTTEGGSQEGGGGGEAGMDVDGAEMTGVAGGGGGGGSRGGYGGEAALLAALSASGRCPASDVRAMSSRVVEVIEALLQEGIVVSHANAYTSPTAAAARATNSFSSGGGQPGPTATAADDDSAGKGVGGGIDRPAAAGDDKDPMVAEGGRGEAEAGTPAATGGEITSPKEKEEVSTGGGEGVARGGPTSPPLAGRADRVAGVFHPSVAAENAARLDACYWARVSARGRGGGVEVLDEAFVLTPSLR